MTDIKILPTSLANKIAAGEVVERPVSVVKELVENALDAGAAKIIVEIKKGGIEQISVSDNGSGIPRANALTAFLRHATSKLADEDDLYKIATMGFRGEALSSICAVSEVTLITRTNAEEIGTQLSLKPGNTEEIDDIGCNIGTTLVVSNLFNNVPARMKFLKRNATETAYITDTLGKIALSAPQISFKYIVDGETIFVTNGDGDLRNAIFEIYGKDCAKSLMDMDYTAQGIKIHGVLGTAEISRGNRARQTIFVNGRYVRNYVLSKVVEDAYKTMLQTGKFPFFVINIEVPYELVDVNVHPAKTEVKFADEKYVCRELYHAARRTLGGENTIRAVVDRPQKAENVSQIVNPIPQKPKTPDWAPVHDILKSNKVSDSAAAKTDDYDTKYDKFTAGSRTEENHVGDGVLDVLQNTISVPQEPENLVVNEALDVPQNIDTPQTVAPRRIVGQAFETYLIIEQENQLYLVDQHAAHERINYEKIMSQLRSKENIEGQILLTPEIISFTATEKAEILENIEVFASLGFVLEDFGASDIIVRETPVPQSVDAIKENVLDALKLLVRHRNLDLTDIREKILHSVACKSSVRAGRKLSDQEAAELLTQLDNLGGINTCPHGRPIKVEITRRELEKMFGRA
ncbi:MAG: DNA mismatch repair endonuclease MutL [Oscillospiraceae bacterium]|nr:DNA mismatch repair endonuclease MutL [Oscillospiraceae bacterium]